MYMLVIIIKCQLNILSMFYGRADRHTPFIHLKTCIFIYILYIYIYTNINIYVIVCVYINVYFLYCI